MCKNEHCSDIWLNYSHKTNEVMQFQTTFSQNFTDTSPKNENRIVNIFDRG